MIIFDILIYKIKSYIYRLSHFTSYLKRGGKGI